MKLPHSPRGGHLLTGIAAIVGMISPVSADPKIPRGNLEVDRSLVRAGAQSMLKWHIEYPTKITDKVGLITPHILTPKKDMKMKVRILGSSFHDLKTNAGHGNNVDGVDASNPGQGGPSKIDTDASVDDEYSGAGGISDQTDYPVEVLWSRNGSAWSRIYYGKQSSIVPTAVVHNTQVAKGDSIDFGGRGFLNDWMTLYTTSMNTPNVLVFKDGDPVPSFIVSYRVGLIKGFLKPYLSSDYKTFKLGENDFVVMMELDQKNPNKSGFDLQDLAILVTFD